MAIVKKRIRGKEYLYEVRYENGKQKWKYLGRASNSITNRKEASRELQSGKESHKRFVITRSRVQIPPAALGTQLLNPQVLYFQNAEIKSVKNTKNI